MFGNSVSGESLAAVGRAEITRAIRTTKDGTRVFFDRGFPWIAAVESRWHSIRQEFDRISQAMELLPGIEEISKVQAGLTTDRRWKIFPFFAYGHEVRKNQERCPQTAAALRMIPGVRAAMFSILQPGKSIPPHQGVYCGVLRFHLGIKVPKPESLCGICVGGQVANWREGQSIVFDDTHTHFVWNRSAEERAVLLVDFPRPLDVRLREINERVINSMAETLVDNVDVHWGLWEQTYGVRFDALISRIPAAAEAR